MGEHSFCAVPTANTIYAGPKTKEEFDLIPLPVCVHDWCACSTTTLIKNDGQAWERRCHSKLLDGRKSGAGVNVIFQWFERRPASVASLDVQEAQA